WMLPGLKRFFAHPRIILGVFAVLCAAAAIIFLRQLPTAMERNLENLTNDPPKGHRELLEAQDRANSSFGKSLSGAVALLDTREEADKFCEVVKERMKQAPYKELIDGCDTISSVVPRQQEEKLAVIREIAAEVPDSILTKV